MATEHLSSREDSKELLLLISRQEDSMTSEKQKAAMRRYIAKRRLDPAYREGEKQYQADRYQNDPDYRERRKALSAASYQRRKMRAGVEG